MPIVEISPAEENLLFLSDIQPQRTFDIFAYEKCVERCRRFKPSTIVVVGDIIENINMYRDQWLKTWDVTVQKAVVIKLLKMLAEAAGARRMFLIPGNHDLFMGSDAAIELAAMMWFFRNFGCEVIPTGEMLIIRYGDKNILAVHRLGRCGGSYVTGMSAKMLKVASDLVIELSKMGIRIDAVVTGHTHKSSQRWNAFELITLPGWSMDYEASREARGIYVMTRDLWGLIRVEPTPTIFKEHLIEYMDEFAKNAMKEFGEELRGKLREIAPKAVKETLKTPEPTDPIYFVVRALSRAGYSLEEIVEFIKESNPELFNEENLPKTLKKIAEALEIKHNTYINWFYHAFGEER